MNLIQILKRRLRTLDQRFYYVCFVWALLLPNVVLYWTSSSPYPQSIINLFLPLGIYMAFFAIFKKPGRGLMWTIPLILINAFQLVLLTIFSGSVIAVDMILNLFTSNSDEAGELLSGIILPIAGVLSVYGLATALAIRSIKMRSELSLKTRRVLTASGLIIATVMIILAFRRSPELEGYKLRNEVYPLSVFNNMRIALGKLQEVASYEQTSADFSYNATSERSGDLEEIYIFVLGETSRAYSWELYGYPRATNPKLMRRREQMSVFTDVITQSNTTYKSVPILLSPADAHHAEDLPKVKGLLTAMREAGFYTIYLSNQPENRSFVDFFAMQANQHHRIKQELYEGVSLLDRQPIYDTDMLPYVDRALAAGHRKLFIVLHSYGAHFSYKDRYPRMQAHFLDDQAERASVGERKRLINGYDNAIRLTDLLLDSLMTKLEAKTNASTALFYISDHGEDVYDDERERILHSSPSLSYYQLHIPALFWASPAYKQHFPERVESARGNAFKPVSSNVTFHTLLDMAGVRTSYRSDSLSLLRPELSVGPRVYLNDRYECVKLDELGLQEEDRTMWRRMRLAPFWRE